MHAEASTCQVARVNDLPELTHSGRTTADQSMSMRVFFAYLHDREATTDLAQALGNAAMPRTSGARSASVLVNDERLAS